MSCSIVKKLWKHSKEACIVLLTQNDAHGNIPLHLACLKGKNEIVDEFLKIMTRKEVPKIAKRLVFKHKKLHY